MKTVTITIKEYCDLSGYSVRNTTQHINNGTLLPYMRSVRRSGSTWLIDVMADWYESKQNSVPKGMICHHTYQVYKNDGNFYCGVCGVKVKDLLF